MFVLPAAAHSESSLTSADVPVLLLLLPPQHDHAGRPVSYLHRDIKLSNTTYNQKHDFFVVIDYGTFCNVDRSDWFAARDLRWVRGGAGLVGQRSAVYSCQFVVAALTIAEQ